MLKVKITSVGNSMGILLPKEALIRLKAECGDTLFLVEGPDGYTIMAYQQNFEQQISVAEKLMKRFKNILCNLAK